MTIERFPYEVSVLPDKVRVKFDGKHDPKEADALIKQAIMNSTPRARIEKLRRHPEMGAEADRLQALLAAGVTDDGFFDKIALAEKDAFLLDAHPKLLRDAKRQAGARKERRPEITHWIEQHLRHDPRAKSPDLWKIAPEFITDAITEHPFKKRVTAVRKKMKCAANK